MIEAMLGMDSERQALSDLARILDPADRRYIFPAITGSAASAIDLSRRLMDELNVKALPIRTPTVPAGTERVRMSLSSGLPQELIISVRKFLDSRE